MNRYLRFKSHGCVGTFNVVHVERFDLVFHHVLTVAGQKRTQAEERFLLHVDVEIFYEINEHGKEILFGA